MGWEPLRLPVLPERAQSHNIAVRSSLSETRTAKLAPPMLMPHQKRLTHLTDQSLTGLDSHPVNGLARRLAYPPKNEARPS